MSFLGHEHWASQNSHSLWCHDSKTDEKKKKQTHNKKDEGKAVLWIRMFIIFQLLTHIELKDALQHIVTWFQVAAQP